MWSQEFTFSVTNQDTIRNPQKIVVSDHPMNISLLVQGPSQGLDADVIGVNSDQNPNGVQVNARHTLQVCFHNASVIGIFAPAGVPLSFKVQFSPAAW